MGFSALLPQSSGICCVGGPFGVDCSSSWSPLFGRPWLLPACLNAIHIDRRFAVAAVRNEFRKQEKKEEEKQKNQLLGVASASIGFNTVLLMSVTKPALPVSPRKVGPYSWLSLPLLAVWGAILLNAFVQYRILERLTCLPPRRESSGGRVEFTLNQRVAELEENVREFVITARGLVKQVEKLGVRFRATKRTLRDPMQETATIAQKTSEVATTLVQRGDRLEEELRGLQLALLAMQDHQVKQLALISLALKRTQNNNNSDAQATKTKAKTQLSSSVNGSGSGQNSDIKTSAADTHARVAEPAAVAQEVAQAPKKAVEVGSSSNGKFSSEGSLSKVDFWKDSVTSSSAVVEKMSVGSPPGVAENSNLGSFFNGRKRSPNSSPPETKTLNTPETNMDSEAQVLPEAEYVEQPDYDSDSWLR